MDLDVASAAAGCNTAVIDLDPQASAANWADRREPALPVTRNVPPAPTCRTCPDPFGDAMTRLAIIRPPQRRRGGGYCVALMLFTDQDTQTRGATVAA